MKLIDQSLLDNVVSEARISPRLRMNYNFHDTLDDPVNRMINALEPGAYLRPHRHLSPSKDEIFLLLQGKIAVLFFNDSGQVEETIILDPSHGQYGVDIPAGTWHTILVLETGSVIYEVKEGPFCPLAAEDFASWAPAAEDTVACNVYLQELMEIVSSESIFR